MEEEKGISVADIFRIIFSQKLLALILTLAITVVGIIVIIFIYNPNVAVYSVKFSVNMPGGSSDGLYYLYPDGTIIYYSNMVSEEYLSAVKDGKSGGKKFPDVDIEKLLKGIEMTSEVSSDENSDPVRQFTITAKQSCFKDDKEAREFLKAVTEVTVKYFGNMPADDYLHLNYSKNDVDYVTEINSIQNQINYLKSQYRTLANNYGYGFIVDLGSDATPKKSIQSYIIDIDNYLDTGVIDSLLGDIEKKGCVRNQKTKDRYELELAELKQEHEKAKVTLDKIMEVTVTDNTQVIKQQSDLVLDLAKKMEIVEGYTKGGPSEEIETRINELYEDVVGFTDMYRAVYNAVYNKLAVVLYEDANIVTPVGGISIPAAVVACVIIAVIAACIAAYFVGLAKLRKKTKVASLSTETPPEAVPYGSEVAASEQPSKQDKN